MSEISSLDKLKKIEFKNRNDSNPKRKKIKIISQTPNEIIADIERNSQIEYENKGTALNAELFNILKDNIVTAVETSNKNFLVKSEVKIDNVNYKTINFKSDPQTQLDNLNAYTIENKTNLENFQLLLNELNNKICNYSFLFDEIIGEGKCLVVFEVDNLIYKRLIVDKETAIKFDTPTETDTYIFHNWMHDNTIINTETYSVKDNIKFVANITKKYKVSFLNEDNSILNSEYYVSGSSIQTYLTPVKEGYVFDGWLKDGELVDFNNFIVNENIEFRPLFTKLHTVIFKYEDSILSEQIVRNEDFANETMVNIPDNNEFKEFLYWEINEIEVAPSTYNITSDTIFIAKIRYLYKVDFSINNSIYETQYVEYGGTPNYFDYNIYLESGQIFNYWIVNGEICYDESSYEITENTIFEAYITYCQHDSLSYESLGDGTHNSVCLNCGTIVEYGTTCSLSIVSSDENGHTVQCSECGYEETLSHNFNSGDTCSDCGYTDTGYNVTISESESGNTNPSGIELELAYTDNRKETITIEGNQTYCNVISIQLLPNVNSSYIYYEMDGVENILEHKGSNLASDVLILTGDIFINCEVLEQNCILSDTLVTMADGTKKAIGDIAVGDRILSYNFESGRLIANPVIYASSQDSSINWTTIRYFKWTFSDGTVIKNAFAHRFYNIEQKSFVYINLWNIGEHIFKEDGTIAQLISKELIKENCTFERIIGQYGTNYFANGCLTGDRHCPSNLDIATLETVNDL